MANHSTSNEGAPAALKFG